MINRYVLNCKKLNTAISRAKVELSKKENKVSFKTLSNEYLTEIANAFIYNPASAYLSNDKKVEYLKEYEQFRLWCVTQLRKTEEKKSGIFVISFRTADVKFATMIVNKRNYNKLHELKQFETIDETELDLGDNGLRFHNQIQEFCKKNHIDSFSPSLDATVTGKYGAEGYGYIVYKDSSIRPDGYIQTWCDKHNQTNNIKLKWNKIANGYVDLDGYFFIEQNNKCYILYKLQEQKNIQGSKILLFKHTGLSFIKKYAEDYLNFNN